MSSAITAAIIVGGAGIYSAKTSSDAVESAAETQSEAALTAAEAEVEATQMAIDYQEESLAKLTELLSPWVESGTTALTSQMALAGLAGESAQTAAIESIKSSSEYTSLIESGEEAILQNAAATGGLRGGNTQAALAEYSPSILSQLIETQYSRLSDISSTGLQAASSTGSAVSSTGTTVSNAIVSQGQSTSSGLTAAASTNAQASLSQAQINSDLWGDLAGLAASTLSTEEAGGF